MDILILISDRYGFNNNNEIYSKNKILILFWVTASYIGVRVNNQDNVISNFEKNNYFKDREILNLGYSGNGPLLTYATLIEYFPKICRTRFLDIL